MKLYYLTEKKSKEDICFWDADLKIGYKKYGCLAFFYKKEFAENYKNYLEKDDKTNLVIRSIKIGATT